MSPGIRAEVNVDPAGTCPVVETSIAAGAPAHSVSKAVPAGDPERVTEEFTIESDDPVTGTDVELSSVFEYGAATVYRFTRERGRGCPCELVERFDAPLADVRARKGSLRLVFIDTEGYSRRTKSIGPMETSRPGFVPPGGCGRVRCRPGGSGTRAEGGVYSSSPQQLQ
jgi:hypothetical protein